MGVAKRPAKAKLEEGMDNGMQRNMKKEILDTNDKVYFLLLQEWSDSIASKEKGKILFLSKEFKYVNIKTVEIQKNKFSIVDPFAAAELAEVQRARYIILAHNRLNDDVYPTIREIRQVKQFLENTKDASLLSDYMIVSQNGYCSFKDNDFFKDQHTQDVAHPSYSDALKKLVAVSG